METGNFRILTVVPIAKVIGKEFLSYWSSVEAPIGSIVSIPLRKKVVEALVVETREASNLKTDIRRANFSLKKIQKGKPVNLFSPEFLNASKKTADYFASNLGTALQALLSKTILENVSKIERPKPAPLKTPIPSEKFLLQADDEERYANYKSLIREEFARKHSVFFCLPTIEDIKRAKETLEKGIEQYTFILHASLKKNEIISTWNKIAKEDHPVLIIATPSFLSAERPDLGTIILEKENSRSYKMMTRPYIDARTFCELYAKEKKVRLIMGDMLLRAETLWREKRGDFMDLSPLKFRSLSSAEQKISDISERIKKEKGLTAVIDGEIEEAILQTRAQNGRMFIFAGRRGLSPNTICADCGSLVFCNTCKAPTILHKNDENFFLCHRCGETRDASEACTKCGSWKLQTLGFGLEAVESAIKEKFPLMKIFKIDRDSVTTHKKASDIVKKFEKTPGGILLGTEMALNFINEKVETSVITAVDSLFSIPDFRIGEKIMLTLLRIRYLTLEKIVLQTRNPAQSVWNYALQGNLNDFYREEIGVRESLKYPPFSIFIKITLQGEKKRVEEETRKLEEILTEYKPISFPAFISETKGRFTMHTLLRLEPGKWVDRALLAKLLSLPPYFMVRVDPESLL